jgi:gluconate 5-dehydrogenase
MQNHRQYTARRESTFYRPVEYWSRSGVTCNAVAPGFFPTSLTSGLFSDPVQATALANQTMTRRNGHASDLHGAAIFLASDASEYVTGQTLFVDGGFSAG